MLKWILPLAAVLPLAGCVQPGIGGSYSGIVSLQSIPANRPMTVEAAEKYLDEKMGVIGWSKAPKAYEQSKNNQYNICSISGALNSQVRFVNLTGSSFVATAARGIATFNFSQPGRDCPAQLHVTEITQVEAEMFASAVAVLANAERSGLRQSSAAPDRDQWAKIEHSDDPADFQSFVMTYPASAMTSQALERMFATRRAVSLAKGGGAAKKLTAAPLQPPASGLVIESVLGTGKMKLTISGTTRTKVVNGTLDNYVEEITLVQDTVDGAGSRTHMDTQTTYRGPYSLLVRSGKQTNTSKMRVVLAAGNVTNYHTVSETSHNIISGSLNNLFPLKIGNFATVKYSVTTASTVNYSRINNGSAAVFVADVSGRTEIAAGTNSSTSRIENEISCLVDGYKSVKVRGVAMDAYKLFCANRSEMDINGGKWTTYSFTDSYYSPKLRVIVQSVTATAGSPDVWESEYAVISNPG